LLMRTAYSSRIRRISSTASSPTRSAPAFSISRRTAAVESSPFRIKITRKELKSRILLRFASSGVYEPRSAFYTPLAAAFEPFSSTVSCQSAAGPVGKKIRNVRPSPPLRPLVRPGSDLTLLRYSRSADASARPMPFANGSSAW
jgi:hypothetical protein